MLELSDFWLNFIVGTSLPMVVALVTKKVSDPQVKALTLLALSAITGPLLLWQATGGALDVKTAFTGAVVTFITAVGSHFGLLKPTGLSGADSKLADLGNK